VEILLQETERSHEINHNESNSDQDYSRVALELSLKRQQLLQKANRSLSSKQHPSVTAHYLERVIIYLTTFSLKSYILFNLIMLIS